MPLLRLTQTAEGDDAYRVEIESDGPPRQTATAKFSFALTPQDDADLRWYLEDYLEWPDDPTRKVAERVEARMKEIGTDLFRAIFQANDDARDFWTLLRADLADTRVEVVTGVREATAIPWELLRDPKTDVPLALRCRAFVRALHNPVQPPTLPDATPDAIRILLVICRPRGDADVPFRSVASRILKSLTDEARAIFDLDVLRPPTFDVLSETLRRAQGAGHPYHVVHFDGHGAYADFPRMLKAWKEGDEEERRRLAKAWRVNRDRFSPETLYPRPPRPGAHGFLVFESAAASDANQRWVDGQELGQLLVETAVPVLVLNACRSAHADVPEAPEAADDGDAHEQRRAWGSLAQEVMDAGVAGVVAMRYNVYVVTAAQFVADLYASLAQGRPLGQAVTLGRKQLHAKPLRTLAFDPLSLQDWVVPVVYEAAPIALFPERAEDRGVEIHIKDAASASAGGLDPSLPPTPDAGFFGRDETLLALDRAFDSQRIVLLHAYAGSGKTATAAEFARWYALTGGVEGPVLFTSFEQYTPLARVLDRVGQVFGQVLEPSGVHWLALDDAARRQVALQVLEQIPVLWIWDNVEPVAGFPTGADSAWSADEQRELVDFLRAARDTQARFLLTSRRDEQAWLGGLPMRVRIPKMPMTERLQLARALAEKHRRRAVVMKDWRPLLVFSDGNPLALTVLVGQALRDRLAGHDAVAAFVERLRSGEAAFDDVESEGRSRSLGASLGYGFEHAFNEGERRQLALLHLFQGFVDVDALCLMGDPDTPGSLPEAPGLSRDDGITLLDRAAEVGLLTRHGGGYYGIHPALPWFFRGLFEHYYGESQEATARAFVGAMGVLGNYYLREYESGNRDVIGVLRAEEANLLQARRLARVHGWWRRVISAMQGLRKLYDHTGRRAEWKRLVTEIVPDFVDPETEDPLSGQEDDWGLVTQYRVRLAREERNLAEAERLQQVGVEWNRKRVAPLLARARESLDGEECNTVRNLAASLHELGEIRRELGREACVASYEESLQLSESIGERAGAASCAFNLGHAYKDLSALRDLDQAEHWYRRSLDLRDERDRLGRGLSLGELGNVAWQRFRARKAGANELLRHLNEAVSFYHQKLELTPSDAVNELAVAYNALGVIYGDAGDVDRALPHYRDAIRYREHQGNLYGASQTRFNVALDLANAGRLQDALAYAEAALRGFESYGESAAEDVQRTRQLIEDIRKAS